MRLTYKQTLIFAQKYTKDIWLVFRQYHMFET